MKKFFFLFSFCCFFVFCVFSARAENEMTQTNPVTCHNVQPVVSVSKNLILNIDEQFGGVVEILAKVLFYQPFETVVTDQEGQPVFEQEPVVDSQGVALEQTFFYVQGKDIPRIDQSGVACLNDHGQFQFNEDNRPWLTHWSLVDGGFSYSQPFLNADAQYVYKDGSLFRTKDKLKKTTNKKKTEGMPLVVMVLFFGALFYTFWYKFINIRLFKHAIHCIRGKYDNPKDPGEISHFQALTSALSATVGLGNIAGVAVAIGLGGPGATFWMILMGLLGMTSKFHECTLGQLFRRIDDKGVVHGGPKYYLSQGFADMGWPKLGKVLAIIFAVFLIAAAFGGGNMFQANQSYSAVKDMFPFFARNSWAFGALLAFFVGLVIIGGIKRIGTVTEKLVPIMCGIYVLASLYIIFRHFSQLPEVVSLILREAFSFRAGLGGFVGVAVMGIRRAAFSNEAGIGSASIAHAAARTKEPVREGVVSLLEPFVDTVVICSMTAFVVIITNAYNNPVAGSGVEMTNFAFRSVLSWFPIILTISVVLFAYSTMISWSYYGERAWEYLFGFSKKTVLVYRMLFLFCIVFGSITSLTNVINFTDLVFLSVAFPNILGGIWLSKLVKRKLEAYMTSLKNGEFVMYK